MKLLCNENFPLASVQVLRKSGHDVVSITELSPGISDATVLKLSHDQRRILITFDADYGELVYLRNLSCPPSILYLRFSPRNPSDPAEVLQTLLGRGEEFLRGFFLTVERATIRRRPLPLLQASER